MKNLKTLSTTEFWASAYWVSCLLFVFSCVLCVVCSDVSTTHCYFLGASSMPRGSVRSTTPAGRWLTICWIGATFAIPGSYRQHVAKLPLHGMRPFIKTPAALSAPAGQPPANPPTYPSAKVHQVHLVHLFLHPTATKQENHRTVTERSNVQLLDSCTNPACAATFLDDYIVSKQKVDLDGGCSSVVPSVRRPS